MIQVENNIDQHTMDLEKLIETETCLYPSAPVVVLVLLVPIAEDPFCLVNSIARSVAR